MSIFSSMRYLISPTSTGNLYAALAFLPFGLFFDFMDGKVARWRKKSSMMGQELDSLADLVRRSLYPTHLSVFLLTTATPQISFGVAPAVVAFAIGMRTPLDNVCLAFFVLCGLTRLARFNVTAVHLPKDDNGKAKYFEGTPIPTTLGLDALMAYWVYSGKIHEAIPFGTLFEGTVLEFHPVLLLFILHGCAMTSRTIHIPKP